MEERKPEGSAIDQLNRNSNVALFPLLFCSTWAILGHWLKILSRFFQDSFKILTRSFQDPLRILSRLFADPDPSIVPLWSRFSALFSPTSAIVSNFSRDFCTLQLGLSLSALTLAENLKLGLLDSWKLGCLVLSQDSWALRSPILGFLSSGLESLRCLKLFQDLCRWFDCS